MENTKKYLAYIVTSIVLVIPMCYGIYTEYFFVRELSGLVILISFVGVLSLFLMGKLIEYYGYESESIEKMKKHDIINSFITKNNKMVLWFFFPLIMIVEELIFRYYCIGFLANQLNLDLCNAVLLSSSIFSLYHIHTWFAYKSLRILLINLGYSFLIGIVNGYILLTLGIIPCILIHFFLVFYLYYSIYKRNFKKVE